MGRHVVWYKFNVILKEFSDTQKKEPLFIFLRSIVYQISMNVPKNVLLPNFLKFSTQRQGIPPSRWYVHITIKPIDINPQNTFFFVVTMQDP
jgi:hypothetical protein